jgi:predicted nucleic acid-binding protein
MPIVVDASVAMAWCFTDEASAATDAVLGRLASEGGLVPDLWRLEVVNVLLAAERRSRISEAQASRFLGLLDELPISVDLAATDSVAVLATGRRHGLSAYDAAYLVLAERLGAPLATLDSALSAAALRAGVELLIKS